MKAQYIKYKLTKIDIKNTATLRLYGYLQQNRSFLKSIMFSHHWTHHKGCPAIKSETYHNYRTDV